jgi:hypothetical protein
MLPVVICSTPCPLQWSLSQLLSDKQWLQHYLQENKRRLREAYASITGEQFLKIV